SFDVLSTSKADQQKLVVDKHNALRRGVNPSASNMLKMKWSPEVAKNAEAWANKCTLSHSPTALRKINVTCGENLFMSTAPSSWPDVVQKWYDEVKNFKYGTGATSAGAVVGHYTQVVWYRSNKVGCAVAHCPEANFQYFYVCQYCPARNNQVPAATPYKIGPKCGDCPGHCDRGLCTNPCKLQDLLTNCANLRSLFGCDFEMVRKKCPAACRCTTEII
ncbi:CRVP protein, partial [Dromaius novaehollandiae]|nr:CRVP protein [Dromaius novaehollandiae]